MQRLYQLDMTLAVKHGLANRSELAALEQPLVPIEEGIDLYLKEVRRPEALGGLSPSSGDRYERALKRFCQFLGGTSISHWNQVDRDVIDAYLDWNVDEEFAPSTYRVDLGIPRQLINHLIEIRRLPESHRFKVSIEKIHQSTTYCWLPAEVMAQVEHCRSIRDLNWLADVIVGLASTGLRISELLSLTWKDFRLDESQIVITNESSFPVPGRSGRSRQTKSRRSRTFPIEPQLRQVLDTLGGGPSDVRVFRTAVGYDVTYQHVRGQFIRWVRTPLTARFPTPAGEPKGFVDGLFHSYRHFFCSTCANSRVPEEVVMKWLGQASVEMVRYYYHLHNAESQR